MTVSKGESRLLRQSGFLSFKPLGLSVVNGLAKQFSLGDIFIFYFNAFLNLRIHLFIFNFSKHLILY